METRVYLWGLIAAGAVSACGSDADPAATPASAQEGGAQTTQVTQTTSVGTIAFTIEGDEKRFDYLPASGNHYSPLASSVMAKASAESNDTLTITFMAIDLTKLNYPIELPLPKTVGQNVDPMAAMANVAFIYIDKAGTEWSGPGKVTVESFSADGRIAGTFKNVSVPHTDKELPNVILTNGSFRAEIE
jgi:hypothetical protein